MFTGREFDGEIGMYYYRAREYSPAMGRFLQRDPIGTADQVNLYTYVGNNPMRWVGLMGMMTEDEFTQKYNRSALKSWQTYHEKIIHTILLWRSS